MAAVLKNTHVKTWRLYGSYLIFAAALLYFAYGMAIGFYETFMPLLAIAPMTLGLAVLGLALHPKGPKAGPQLQTFGAAAACLAGAALVTMSYSLVAREVWHLTQDIGHLVIYLGCLWALDSALDPEELRGFDRAFRVGGAIVLPFFWFWVWVMSNMRLD